VLRSTRWLLPTLVLAAGATLGCAAWWKWHDIDACTGISPLPRFVGAALQDIGVVRFRAESCQDRWIALEVYPGPRKGYFVDVGSGDGELHSNTKVLEDLGWEGVCIDPFPTNMAGRRCTLFTVPVYSVSGKRVRFHTAGVIGGIDESLGRWKGQAERARVVELETRTLTELLAEAKAPQFIHYMSMDIEGAELEALKGLDFSRYRIGALTIEHNFEEPKRGAIRAFLESKGYRRERSVDQDDFYVSTAQGQ
jgi:FkbM family methyltransferase